MNTLCSISKPFSPSSSPFAAANHLNITWSTDSDDQATQHNTLMQLPEERCTLDETFAGVYPLMQYPELGLPDLLLSRCQYEHHLPLSPNFSGALNGHLLRQQSSSSIILTTPVGSAVAPYISFSQQGPQTPDVQRNLDVSEPFSLGISPIQQQVTPFGKSFELSSPTLIWPSSEPFMSPVVHASVRYRLSPRGQSPISFDDADMLDQAGNSVIRSSEPQTNSAPTNIPSSNLLPFRQIGPSSPAEISCSTISCPVAATQPINLGVLRSSTSHSSADHDIAVVSPLSPLTPLSDIAPPGCIETHLRRPIPRSPLSPSIFTRRSDRAISLRRVNDHRASSDLQHQQDNRQDSGSRSQLLYRLQAREHSTKEYLTPQMPTGILSNRIRDWPRRTFPQHVVISEDFLLFYRRFPVSTYYRTDPADPATNVFKVTSPGGLYNPPREPLDLYTPRFVKGKGREKVGLCPVCIESVDRGGEGKSLWLSMKFSAYNYHLQYAHGISAISCRPFSPPLDFRTVMRPAPGRHERSHIKQGKCHKCQKWIAVEGIKDIEMKVKELLWWKHAAVCHQGSVMGGEMDLHYNDVIFKHFSNV